MQTGHDWRHNHILSHLRASAAVKQQMIEQSMNSILAAAELIIKSFSRGGKLLLCGNGGSAADCQHLAAEFTNRLTADFERPGLPAIALTTDTSFITAHANDYEFAGIYERQIQALGKPGDVLIGISTSGNSANIIRAVAAAQAANIHTITLTGCKGPLVEMATVALTVPSENTQYIQEAHLAIEHILCHLVERTLFARLDGI
jgi:D-sedoheptulose 7-phosphate isomerase